MTQQWPYKGCTTQILSMSLPLNAVGRNTVKRASTDRKKTLYRITAWTVWFLKCLHEWEAAGASMERGSSVPAKGARSSSTAQLPRGPKPRTAPEPDRARPAGCVLALSSPQLLLLAPLTCTCVLHDYRRSNQSAPRNLSNSRVPRKGLQQLERWWLSSMVSLASYWSLARTAVQVLAPLFGSLLSCWHQQMNSWILLAFLGIRKQPKISW